jgi:hypothetical protein
MMKNCDFERNYAKSLKGFKANKQDCIRNISVFILSGAQKMKSYGYYS